MSALKAVIWDVDGTLADTERDGHLVAFNRAFSDLGLPWRWDEATYCRLLTVSGGRERLLADMAQRQEAPVAVHERQALAEQVHRAKNRIYAELVREGRVALRPGVMDLLAECREAGVRLAIATTTSRSNLDALLGAHFRHRLSGWFEVSVCGEDVRTKKPDPEVYHQVLSRLQLQPLDCVAIEDSPGGAAAARAADIPVVVTRSACFMNATFDSAIAIGPDLGTRAGWRPAASLVSPQGPGIGLDQLRAWHAEMNLVSQFG